MPDIRDCRPAPLDLGEALRALPLERPPVDGWPRLARELAPRRRRLRLPLALAAAAALVAALGVPRLLAPPAPTPVAATGAAMAAADPLPALARESALLEAVLAAAADDQVGSGASLLLRARMQQRIQLVDALLADPATDREAQLPLWQERVLLLRGLAGLESGEQVLASRGDVARSTLVVTL